MFRRHEKPSLHPLFGTYCMTEQFRIDSNNISKHIHFEAWQDDPIKKTWSVTKVTENVAGSTSVTSRNETVKSKTSFEEALKRLAEEESTLKAQSGAMPLLPRAAEMEYLHYRAFAEREGFVFDIIGKPHMRPAAHILPSGPTFITGEIEIADKHLKRPANDFSGDGPLSQLPQTHFLFDYVSHTKHLGNHKKSMNEIRVLDILDHYVTHIEDMQKALQEYADTYQGENKGYLIGIAEDALKISGHALQQLKAYGIDTTEFDNFNKQCRLACKIIHAEGLYNLMRAGKMDIMLTEPLFKSRVKEAEDILKEIDPSPKATELLKSVIVQSGKLVLPPVIHDFITRYKAQRAMFYDQKTPPSPPQP